MHRREPCQSRDQLVVSFRKRQELERAILPRVSDVVAGPLDGDRHVSECGAGEVRDSASDLAGWLGVDRGPSPQDDGKRPPGNSASRARHEWMDRHRRSRQAAWPEVLACHTRQEALARASCAAQCVGPSPIFRTSPPILRIRTTPVTGSSALNTRDFERASDSGTLAPLVLNRNWRLPIDAAIISLC